MSTDEKNAAETTAISSDLQAEVARIVAAAYRVAANVGQDVEQILREAHENPLTPEELVRLLTRAAQALKDGAARRGDSQAVAALEKDVDALIRKLADTRRSELSTAGQGARSAKPYKQALLLEYNGIKMGPVFPSPTFHEREIPMLSGFVRTTDIALWENNERLDIHLRQFCQKFGRGPTPEELLDLMLNKLVLPGVEEGDAFEIVELARSVANNGVRKPPIMDTDGTLLDGNRRVAACNYILSSDEFTNEQKKRAEYIFAWQLTQHATKDDRDRVVVSLNFESDCKLLWPEYVKARKVFEEWMAMLAIEYPAPARRRQAEMKRALSQRFALGPDTAAVRRYIRMVQWANEFEDYQVNVGRRGEFEVKHRANDYFQYFDELSKGASPGTVAVTLNQNEPLKHLMFDLLFQDKIKNFTIIRDLKYVNDEIVERLRKLRDKDVRTADDLEAVQDEIEDTLAAARANKAEARSVGANTRIETFVKWLEELPVKAFRDEIRPENLQRLLKALTLVRGYAEENLGADGTAS